MLVFCYEKSSSEQKHHTHNGMADFYEVKREEKNETKITQTMPENNNLGKIVQSN